MLLYYFLAYAFITLVVSAANVNLTEILAELPPCSLPCIITGLSSSPGALSNPQMTYTNRTLQHALSTCIQTKCNYIEQSQVAVVNTRLCEGIPFESRSWPLSIVGLVCAPVAIIAVALRCYARIAVARQFGWDDFITVVAAVFLAALVVLDLYNAIVNGFGRHFWNIDPLKVMELLQIFYVAEIFYIVVITLVKTSILLFYLRVFPGFWFRIVSFTTMAAVLSSGLAIIFAIIFQCAPVAGAWNKTIPSKCVNLNMLAYASSGIGIVLDVIIIILPIPDCLMLRMNKRKKFNVLFMFALGSIACITSMVRLKYIVNFGSSFDQTWDNVIPAIWSFLEICVATICACLPALRSLLSRWMPSIFDIHRPDTPYNSNPSKSSNPTSQSASQPPRNRHTEKVGPSYNKRVIKDPDDEFLDTLDEPASATTETKVWINPKFDGAGNIVEEEENNTKASSETSKSIFVLQGPRLSDEDREDDNTSVGIGIALSDLSSYPEPRGVETGMSAVQPLTSDERMRNASYRRLRSLEALRNDMSWV